MRGLISIFIPLVLVLALINCQEHVPATEPVAAEELSDEDALLRQLN